jgi:4-hydroxy-3-methylbut-2-enyl diphosphate reductase
LGDDSHAEVQGLVGYAKSSGTKIINGLSDLASLDLERRVGVVSQTTQRDVVLRELVGALAPRVDELRVFNTVCDSTAARLNAALEIAAGVDLLLVVGGKDSANTRRLRDTCREILPATYQIETCDDIDPNWLRGKSKVGVTAGASTPEWVIAEVVGHIQGLSLPESAQESSMVCLTSMKWSGGTANNDDRRDSGNRDRQGG